jgi:hypothetical protein
MDFLSRAAIRDVIAALSGRRSGDVSVVLSGAGNWPERRRTSALFQTLTRGVIAVLIAPAGALWRPMSVRC